MRPAERAARAAWRAHLKTEPCVYCGRHPDEIPGGTGRTYITGGATKTAIEHVFSKAKRHTPGSPPRTWADNEVSACWNCNQDRGEKPIVRYLIYRRVRARLNYAAMVRRWQHRARMHARQRQA